MSNQAASDRIFDALGEPARRRILEVLREGPLAVGVLADRLPIGRPAVSKHLRVLSGAGLIEHRQAGTSNLYSLAPLGLVEAQQWLSECWDSALAAFAAYVAEQPAQLPPPPPKSGHPPLPRSGPPPTRARTRSRRTL